MWCVLVVDMLYEFVYGKLGSPGARSIVSNIVKIVNFARDCAIPIIHVVDSHLSTDIEVRKIWGPHAMKGTPEARIIPELEPKTDREFVLEKRWYSGFRDTGLNQLLKDLNISRLVITGIATNICVLHTVCDATYERYEVYVVRDATAAIPVVLDDYEKEHELFLKYMERVYKANIVTTEEVLKMLKH